MGPLSLPFDQYQRYRLVEELLGAWVQDEIAEYETWQMRRLSMKPGLTGLWKVSGRNDVDFEAWMELDLSYIDNWSLKQDLRILARRIPAVLSGRGAY